MQPTRLSQIDIHDRELQIRINSFPIVLLVHEGSASICKPTFGLGFHAVEVLARHGNHSSRLIGLDLVVSKPGETKVFITLQLDPASCVFAFFSVILPDPALQGMVDIAWKNADPRSPISISDKRPKERTQQLAEFALLAYNI